MPRPTLPCTIAPSDAAVKMGRAIGVKTLSTAFMAPEATHLLENGEVVYRVLKEVDVPYEVLNAHPTLDLWSFMVVLYRTVAFKPLIEADDRDFLRSQREELILANWGPKALCGQFGVSPTLSPHSPPLPTHPPTPPTPPPNPPNPLLQRRSRTPTRRSRAMASTRPRDSS